MNNAITFRPISENDLEFINKVRNSCVDQLHNSNKYTLNETIYWFFSTKPCWYIILHNNERIGYFRTSEIDRENDSICIGADLDEKWRGKGLAFKAYKQFIDFLFYSCTYNRIWLEVLETNIPAYNLYKKLGFVEEGKKRQAIYKNHKFLDSIIMSILKSEWNNQKS